MSVGRDAHSDWLFVECFHKSGVTVVLNEVGFLDLGYALARRLLAASLFTLVFVVFVEALPGLVNAVKCVGFEATVAALAVARAAAVNNLLLREINELASGDCVRTLYASSRRERPA